MLQRVFEQRLEQQPRYFDVGRLPELAATGGVAPHDDRYAPLTALKKFEPLRSNE